MSVRRSVSYRSVRVATLLVVLLLEVALPNPPSAAMDNYGRTLNLSPSAGLAGSFFTASSPGGWTKGFTVEFFWSSESGPSLGTVLVNDSGGFTKSKLQVPSDAKPGTYWVIACQLENGKCAPTSEFHLSGRAQFTVNPAPGPTPTPTASPPPGTSPSPSPTGSGVRVSPSPTRLASPLPGASLSPGTITIPSPGPTVGAPELPASREIFLGDGAVPIVTATHTPTTVVLPSRPREECTGFLIWRTCRTVYTDVGEARVTITAFASEPTATMQSGIREIRVHARRTATGAGFFGYVFPGEESGPEILRTCRVPAGVMAATCQGVLRLDEETYQITYWATATDHSGIGTRSGETIVPVVSPNELDTDNDYLPDRIELASCTSHTNPDSDRDSLLDGWEAVGADVNRDGTIDNPLPSRGADPCARDMFVTWSTHASTVPADSYLAALVSRFAQANIRLHLDRVGDLPTDRPETGWTRALVWKSIVFPWQRLQTDYFLFFHETDDPRARGSVNWGGLGAVPVYLGSWCPEDGSPCFSERVVGNYNTLFTAFHELGHLVGLGHGGNRVGGRHREGDLIFYDTGAEGVNWKPNNMSALNYHRRMIQTPSGDAVLWDAFTNFPMPSLDETRLDERETSEFARALKAAPVPPGFIRGSQWLTRYTCTKDDGSKFKVATDGSRARTVWNQDSRILEQSEHRFATRGIDWNCNGRIEEGAEENLNGDGGDNEFGEGRIETLRGPGADSAVGVLGNSCPGFVMPREMRELNGNPYCSPLAEDHWDDAYSAYPRTYPLFVPDLRIEACDGTDNDADGSVDEGCPDADKDGVVEPLDNCALANKDQVDLDHDYIGDACEETPPQVKNVSASGGLSEVRVEWQKSERADVVGYRVWRVSSVDQRPVALFDGAGLEKNAVVDKDAPGGRNLYLVAAYTSNGVVGKPAAVEVFRYPIWMLLVVVGIVVAIALGSLLIIKRKRRTATASGVS